MEIEASHLTKKNFKVHFHWSLAKGQGSEHTIEGKQHDLEMHMVHTNTAYETDKAANYKDGYLVVGFLFDEAEDFFGLTGGSNLYVRLCTKLL